MTTDTQALRDLAGKMVDDELGGIPLHVELEASTALRAAADTIDALRAERDMEDFDAGWLAAEARFKGQRDAARAEMTRLRAESAVIESSEKRLSEENERLRAALTEIAETPPLWMWTWPLTLATTMRSIARAALHRQRRARGGDR